MGKRNFIHQLMDVALLMANVSQLKALLVSGHNEYFAFLLTFICLSISLQVVFTICMLVIWSIEHKLEEKTRAATGSGSPRPTLNPNDERDDKRKKEAWADRLDKTGNVLVLFIIVSNVFVAGFGVEGTPAQGTNTGGSG